VDVQKSIEVLGEIRNAVAVAPANVPTATAAGRHRRVSAK
jgi:hypothetical protein